MRNQRDGYPCAGATQKSRAAMAETSARHLSVPSPA